LANVASTSAVDKMLRIIAEIKSDLHILKTKQSQHDHQTQAESKGDTSPQLHDSHSGLADEELGEDPDTNDSVVTIDEDTPELSDEEHLNSQLTTQLLELRH
jgi:hypothetical protein